MADQFIDEDTILYFLRLTLALELRRTHGRHFAEAFLREFGEQIQSAARRENKRQKAASGDILFTKVNL